MDRSFLKFNFIPYINVPRFGGLWIDTYGQVLGDFLSRLEQV